MQEVDAAEGAGDEGPDFVAGAADADTGVATDVGEDVALAKLDEGKLDVVGVGREVCDALVRDFRTTIEWHTNLPSSG